MYTDFQSQLSPTKKLFHCSASAVRMIAADLDLEEIAAGKAIILVRGIRSHLLFGSVATYVLAANEQEAMEHALEKAYEVFPPAAEWTSHIVNLSCTGNFLCTRRRRLAEESVPSKRPISSASRPHGQR